jgi:hypothetical protein
MFQPPFSPRKILPDFHVSTSPEVDRRSPASRALVGLAVFGAVMASVACGSRGDTVGSSRGAVGAGDSTSCTAVFRWLQKDAYKSTAGRTSDAWPPHTTTVLEVHCPDANGNDQVTTAFQNNHGTAPDAVDANGTPILVEVKRSDPLPGTESALMAFMDQYKACQCDPQTQFLSLDNVPDSTMTQILSAVSDYVNQHLTCSGDVTTPGLLAMIQQGDYDDAIAALPSCTWDDGYSWSDGLQQAAQAVVANLGTTIDGYHVCNNDAELQAGLWSSFEQSGANPVPACDNTTAVCQGPAFYYTP